MSDCERFFNTTGLVIPTDHCCVSPLEPLNLNAIPTLARQKKYFVLYVTLSMTESWEPRLKIDRH